MSESKVLRFPDGQIPIFSPEQRRELPVTVFFGGNSSERPGSIKSSLTVANLLKQSGYTNVDRMDITTESAGSLAANRPFGVAFMTMHGGYGEDGTLQGLLEMLDIPYTGSGIAASAISADKVLFSRFVRGLGYNTANQIVVVNANDLENLDMNFPKVIKPATSGCSYGIFFVKDRTELLDRAAFTVQFSDRMLVEDYIEGRELTVGLFEDPRSKKPHVLPIVEYNLEREIQDFETKSVEGRHLYKTIIPAELNSTIRDKITAVCTDIFQQLNCRSYVRMDLRLTSNGEIYVLENNTSPGMLSMEESDFPRMLQAGGIDPLDFVDLMIETSLLNHRAKHSKYDQVPSEKEMRRYLGLRSNE